MRTEMKNPPHPGGLIRREVFEPLGLAIPTTLVSSGEDIETFLAKHPAELLMVKPNTGTRSRGIQQVRREELQQLFADRHGAALLRLGYQEVPPQRRLIPIV